MNNDDIKRLAKITTKNGVVNEKVKDFVLNRMPKKDLIIYLNYLNNETRANQIYVTIADTPDKSLVDLFADIFKDKKVSIIVENKLGAGIKVEYNDTIINANVKSMIEQSITSIKNTL